MHCSCGQENPLSANQCPRCGKRLLLGGDPRRLLLDAAAGALLLFALLAVFVFDRLRGGGGDAGTAADDKPTPVVVEGGQPRSLQLAVTPPVYDDVGRLLDALGSGYRHKTISFDDLLDPKKLREYDVVFLTCRDIRKTWLAPAAPDEKRLSAAEAAARREAAKKRVQELKASLREYVGRGGTLYASDWAFDALAAAFPEMVDRAKIAAGAAQTVTADVVDPGLRRRLGATIELNFDKAGWQPAAFGGQDVVTYLEGRFRDDKKNDMTGALLVQFPFERGNVIFTSFHNETQNSDTERELLRYLVFATVTAQLEAGVQQKMIRGGFSPVERNLLSASPKEQSVEQTYECQGTQPLQFALGFEPRGAELRLSVVAPDGTRREESGVSTFTIEMPGAVGQWKYIVTPLKVPYKNFPFTLTVG
jgi:hypothetical protein